MWIYMKEIRTLSFQSSDCNKYSESYLLEWSSVIAIIAIIITLINNLPPWGKDVIYGRGFDKKKFIRAKQ